MSQFKIYVNINDGSLIEIFHKKPRIDMLLWNFEKLLKYIKSDCCRQSININSITAIIFYETQAEWLFSIPIKK